MRNAFLWCWDLGSGKVEWNDDSAVGDLIFARDLETEDKWLSAIVPSDRERARREHASALDPANDSSRWSVTYRLRTGPGQSVAVRERGSVAQDSSGRPFYAVGMLEVMGTEIIEGGAPGQPVLTAEQLGLFFDWLPQLAWSTTTNGWIDFYNRRWYEYTGTTFEEMAGWGWIRVHDPDDLARVTRVYRQAFSTGNAWEDEFRLRRASDGMMRWHLSRAMPVRDESGEIVRWFGTNTDIHDQKLATVEHSRLLARAERARADAEAANEARDRFLAMVSHELRTPLNAVLGWAQLLASGAVDPSGVKSALEKIESNARLQARLIDDLLDVSRSIGGKLVVGREPLDLGAVLGSAIDNMRPVASKAGVEISLRQVTAPVAILGERARVLQIFSNLLTNAIKFGQTGGRVEIDVTTDERVARTTIRDYGVGLTSEQVAHLFDPFWQANTSTTRTHGGLGLGLAIARQLVELHSGTIDAQSEGPGKGAAFTVVLPLVRTTAAVIQDRDEVIEADRLAGIRALVVDDELSAREILASALLSCGATVSTAASVSDALRALRTGTFDVVVSDIAMPEVDGYELVPRARALPGYERLPMIALTAYASEDDRARALRAGYDRHLAKPIEVRVVARSVAELARSHMVSRSTTP